MRAAETQIIIIPHLTSSSQIIDVYVISSWWLAYVRGLPVCLPPPAKSPLEEEATCPMPPSVALLSSLWDGVSIVTIIIPPLQ